MPWYGAVYWPYAYADLFDYTFWPYGYYPGFWDYAYDDFFDGIFFPYGLPYADYADYPYVGPYDSYAYAGGSYASGSSAGSTTGSASANSSSAREVPGQISRQAQELCSQPNSGVTAWPFDRIEKAVQPTADQEKLLDNLKDAASQAAARFKQACPQNVPMTPPGRLAAMTDRLQATLDAVKLVRPPLEKFYESLSDEQKARFNEIGPSVGRNQQTAAAGENGNGQGACNGDESGLTSFPISRIRDEINPTDEQSQRLDTLAAAMDSAVKTLEDACPSYVARTPVGRLANMEKRLEAMLSAANTIRKPLDDFYASLSDEQKADFNQLGRQAASEQQHSSRARHHSSLLHPTSLRSAENMMRRAIGGLLP